MASGSRPLASWHASISTSISSRFTASLTTRQSFGCGLGAVSIATDGTISQGEERVGKVAVVKFDSLSALDKSGDNLYRNLSNQQPQPLTTAVVRQSMLENSNVNSIAEITRMIEVTRAYESMAKMMDSTAELSRRSVERMGRVQ